MKRQLVPAAVVAIVVAWLFPGCVDEQQGVAKTEALLRGDEWVRLASFEVRYHERRVHCSDPESLRYLERCFRENAPTQLDDSNTYEVRLRFVGGGRLDVRTDWSRGGFFLCMPGDRLLQDGGEPRAWVMFRSPVPGRVQEMIDFLNDGTGRARGRVLHVEPGVSRLERDDSLRRD